MKHAPILLALALLWTQPAAAAEVEYFDVTAGDHPHDVAPAPDGTVWYTGQHAGVLGRLDPKTGKVERIAARRRDRRRMASSSGPTAQPG